MIQERLGDSPWMGMSRSQQVQHLTQTEVMPKAEKVKPVHQVRFGAVKAAVWRNDTENGVRFNTTFARIYKDGDNWRSTESFGRDDLLLVAKAADLAHSWIHEQSRTDRDDDDAEQ